MNDPTANPVSGTAQATPAVANGPAAARPTADLHPELRHLITEDGKPVDNPFVEKQYELLKDPLKNSWPELGEGRSFLALTNVGLFFEPKNPAFCPDMMLSLDVRLGDDLHLKPNKSYFVWLLGKVPDVAIEIVSDRRGGEDTHKMYSYAYWKIPYYVIFDPRELLKRGVLRVLGLNQGVYEPLPEGWLPAVGLALRLWHGTYDGYVATWLRWCRRDGQFLPLAKERIAQEGERAEQERQRAEQERQRAEQLRALLRSHGIDPPV
jgi:Uma2 family endonuclease